MRAGLVVLGMVCVAGLASAEELARMVPQQGHSASIGAIAFSPDGAIVATGGFDTRTKLWDAQTGTLLATLRGRHQHVVALAFSPDGTRLVAGYNKEIRLDDTSAGEALVWDVRSGKLIAPLDGHTAAVHGVRFTADGTRVLTSAGGVVRYFDATTGKMLGTVPIANASIAAGNRTHVVLATAERVVVLDATTLKIASDHRVTDPDAVAISPDSTLLAVRGAKIRSKGVRILDRARGNVLRTFDTSVFGGMQFADGKRLHAEDKVTDACDNPPYCTVHHVIRTFDLGGSETAQLEVAGVLVSASSFAGDGVRFAQVSEGSLVVWDVSARARVRTIRVVMPSTDWATVASGDGRFLYSSSEGTLHVWDLANPSVLRTLPVHGGVIASSDDGRRILVRAGKDGNEPTTTVIDSSTAAVVRALTPKRGHDPAMLSRDGSRIVTLDRARRLLEIVDVENGRVVASAKTERTIRYVQLTRDGKRLLAIDDTRLAVFDMSTAAELSHRQLDGFVRSVSGDGRIALLDHGWGDKPHALIVDASTGQVRQRIETNASQIGAAFSNDDTLVAIRAGNSLTGSPRWVRVYDVASGALRMQAMLDEAPVSATFGAANDHVLVRTADGIAHYFQISTGRSISMFAAGNEWLVWNEAGYFDASRSGGELVAAVAGVNGYRIDQLAVRNNRPDLLLQHVGLGSSTAVEHYAARFEHRVRKLGLDAKNLDARFRALPIARIVQERVAGSDAELAIELESSDSALASYMMFVDGVPLERKPLAGNKQRVVETVALTPGRNKIEVSVMDRDGRESMRPFRYVDHATATAKPDLYYIGVGVSKYRDRSYDLQYPHKDVLDLGETLRAMKGTAFADVHIHTIVDEAATVDAIKAARSLIARARPIDIVVLFIAGHGLHASDAAADYYFATHEIDTADLPRTAARFELFEEILQATPARRRLFLMDTCESGEREPGAEPPGPAGDGLVPRGARALVVSRRDAKPRSFLFQRDRYIYNDLARRTGAIVLSSSRGDERSFEVEGLANGAFTQEIMNALVLDGADKDRDGMVTTDELRDHLATAVPAITGNRQHPIVDRDNVDARIALPVVPAARWVLDRDDPTRAPSAKVSPVQRPRGCACSGSASPGATWLMVAILVVLLRRRR